MDTSDGDAERGAAAEFLDWLDSRANAEPSFQVFGDHPPRVTSVCYRDVPEPGSLVGSTFGLSLRPYAPGVGREVLVRVDSADPVWAWAVAHLVARLRDRGALFAVGDTYDFGGPIAESSTMSAFVIGEPTILGGDDTVVHLSNGTHIVLVQAFPLHREELLAFRALPDVDREPAVGRFVAMLKDAVFDVTRPAASLPKP